MSPTGTWLHDAVPLGELHFHLKESAMKPDPGTYDVIADPGLSRLVLVVYAAFYCIIYL